VRLKHAAMVNLGLNLMVSFLPQVDIYAHLGGGLVGALLIGTGLLTRGLGKSTDRARLIRPAAALLSLILLACPVWDIGQGQAWQLSGPLKWQRVTLSETGISLELPSLIATQPRQIERTLIGGQEIVFGQLEKDGMIIDIVLSPAGDFLDDPKRLAEEFKTIKQLRSAMTPEGAKRVGELQEIELGGQRALKEQFRFTNGIEMVRVLQLRPTYTINIEMILWPKLPQRLRPDLDRLFASQQELPQLN